MLVLDLPLLLDLTICMQHDIKRAIGEIASYHERGTSSLPFSWFMWLVHLLAFVWPSLFVSPLMVPPSIYLLLDWIFVLPYPHPPIASSNKREPQNTHQNSEPVRACS
jgi:hypothetical protein